MDSHRQRWSGIMVKLIEEQLLERRVMRNLERLETDIQKRTKNKAKNDKTEHGMEKCQKTKPNRSQKSQTVKVKVNPVRINVFLT
ncbi:hypothetical protein Tco_0930424 [Tanacetum coccineum]